MLHPYHPIIYVRGFAGTQGEIEDTVSDPYMGFNVGSTKSRQIHTGELKRFYFESPLVRLMSDHGYQDVYHEGLDLVNDPLAVDSTIPYKSIVIFRYYDEASADFGTGETPAIEHFARKLSDLILRLRTKVINPSTKEKVAEKDFRVYLVAHSMGGLICRAFLQNPKLHDPKAHAAVDKVFTYATPHNGIDLRLIGNVPGWAAFGDANNFNRTRIASYLDLTKKEWHPSWGEDVSLVKNFDPSRIFTLVGTNPHDYLVLNGLSRWAAGDASDGLVRIENAGTYGVDKDGFRIDSPRAFVHRSHSGYYGIVNSEEGYQNLTRFFFGDVRIDGWLDIESLTLPESVQAALNAGKTVNASYQFEVAVSIRGCQWQMHRRTVHENSAIFRKFAELFPQNTPVGKPIPARSPHLFSVFLERDLRVVPQRKSLAFAVELRVLVPDYEVDHRFWPNAHYEGGYIFHDFIIIEATPGDNGLGWTIKYGSQNDTPNAATQLADLSYDPATQTHRFTIPIVQTKRPGIKALLRVQAQKWNV